jgi:hypothetical protein
MIFSLKDVSHIAVRGLELELHFKDTSSHLRRFASLEEMIAEMKWWYARTETLTQPRPSQLSAFVPALRPAVSLFSMQPA